MSKTRKSRSQSWVLTFAITMVAATTTLTPQPARAVFASEFTQVLNQIQLYLQQANSVTEYGEEAMRWKHTLAQYQQQLVRIQGIISAFGMPQGPELTPVALSHNVAARCGGFSISSLTKVFNLNGSGDIYEQQKQICANIQMMENMKYNATVEFLDKTAAEMKMELQSLDTRRGISNENGNIDANTNDAVRMNTNMEGKFKVWETQISSCDAYIQTMQETQKILAQSALKGKSGLLGTFVKTAALKGALEVND